MHTKDYTYDNRVRLFPLTQFIVEFLPSLVIWDLQFFVGLYLPLFLFSPFIILFACIFDVHSIKFTFHIVLGAPIKILDMYENPIFWFIDYPGFNIVKSLSINLVGVPSFSVGVVLDSIISFYLNCCKYRFFSLT